MIFTEIIFHPGRFNIKYDFIYSLAFSICEVYNRIALLNFWQNNYLAIQ